MYITPDASRPPSPHLGRFYETPTVGCCIFKAQSKAEVLTSNITYKSTYTTQSMLNTQSIRRTLRNHTQF